MFLFINYNFSQGKNNEAVKKLDHIVKSENSKFPQKVTLIQNKNIYCGGVMLSLSHVLTLASCVIGEKLSQGVSKDFENNVTHYYKTFSPSKTVTVGYKLKSYRIAAIDSHSFERSLAPDFMTSGPVDGIAILTVIIYLTQID